ncbi:hypothetical protein GCM10017083_06340 [Thalassobaculum fulvum]|uniref:Uncharacterized protein n=1 Tax=Thalassobaculum fulvum TaxID=1633335 RepID=A0A919CN42_9PROT|nr:hypothetical protein [Thalassobaculum fulvum]GHD41922.1 hypothetical protein GCM10017083_06340 [Thalassobaculum fulvum]
MKLVHPSPAQLAAVVQALYAVASAEGRIAPISVEVRSIDAIQRHLLGQESPAAGTAGPLPASLAAVLDAPDIRRMTVRLMMMLAVIDRRVRPEKVAVVEEAARQLGIEDRGLGILRRAARGQNKRIALTLMKTFVDWWSPSGKAGLRDWLRFVWWMLPQLHGAGTARKNREMLARYQGLATLPEGSFGHTLYRFYADHEIALPGAPKSVPWIMHEVYHVLSEYGVALEAELLLTAFVGGTQEETCMDQILFGLLSYQAGRQIVGGVISEGLLDPEDYFRAMARGARVQVDLVHGWDFWAVAEVDMAELRARYNLPPISEPERRKVGGYNGLLTGSGHSTPADATPGPFAPGPLDAGPLEPAAA